MERPAEIESAILAWKAKVIPFNYGRIWLRRHGSNMRSLGYEPSEITSSPLRDNMAGKFGLEPKPRYPRVLDVFKTSALPIRLIFPYYSGRWFGVITETLPI